MPFNTLNFLFFFFIVAIGYYAVPGKLRWLWLLLSSCYFYSVFSFKYLVVILVSTAVTYLLGLWIQKSAPLKKQAVFRFSLICILFVFVFFKYAKLLDPLFESLLAWKSNPSGTIFNIILPLGFSYFIFTILSYLIEIKRGKIEAERHPGILATALIFFPRIAQGPIERPYDLIPQFHRVNKLEYPVVIEGLKYMLWGYFKKLVIADRLGIYVNAVYETYPSQSGTTLLVASIFYSIQIYTDFSSYTDIAIGAAKILGINLSINFKRPYFSSSIKEFWSRWHITFTSWLRDYLFLPMAFFFSKRMKKQRYFNISTEKWIYLFSSLITFTICGLWHGETWNFVVWGLLFALYLTFAVWMEKSNKAFRAKIGLSKKNRYYVFVKTILIFFLVTFTWIFFRSATLHDAGNFIVRIFSSPGKLYIGEWQQFIYGVFGILLLLVIEIRQEFYTHIDLPYKNPNWFREQLVYISLILLILMVGVFDGGQFIYFRF